MKRRVAVLTEKLEEAKEPRRKKIMCGLSFGNRAGY